MKCRNDGQWQRHGEKWQRGPDLTVPFRTTEEREWDEDGGNWASGRTEEQWTSYTEVERQWRQKTTDSVQKDNRMELPWPQGRSVGITGGDDISNDQDARLRPNKCPAHKDIRALGFNRGHVPTGMRRGSRRPTIQDTSGTPTGYTRGTRDRHTTNMVCSPNVLTVRQVQRGERIVEEYDMADMADGVTGHIGTQECRNARGEHTNTHHTRNGPHMHTAQTHGARDGTGP